MGFWIFLGIVVSLNARIQIEGYVLRVRRMIAKYNEYALSRIHQAGAKLAQVFSELASCVRSGVSTLELDAWIADALTKQGLRSCMKGYQSYRHVSCISVNQELVHGIPSAKKILNSGDLVKVDVSASWDGYCADMARCYVVGGATAAPKAQLLVEAAERALACGIDAMRVGNRLGDISAAIQQEIEKSGYSVVRDFCGHGIGRRMHEEPEIPNYGRAGIGPRLEVGMVFALEPMLTAGESAVFVAADGWTVATRDGSLAAQVENTVILTDRGPEVATRT